MRASKLCVVCAECKRYRAVSASRYREHILYGTHSVENTFYTQVADLALVGCRV
jgi:hypothetical protein